MSAIQVKLSCPRCHAFVSVILLDPAAEYPCPSCGKTLLQAEAVVGFVYVLSNRSMPGLLKIGCTNRCVDERIAELNSATGVPDAFECEAWFVSSHPFEHEQAIHSSLRRFHYNKEFFAAPLTDAVQEIGRVVGKKPDFCRTPPPAPPSPRGESSTWVVDEETKKGRSLFDLLLEAQRRPLTEVELAKLHAGQEAVLKHIGDQIHYSQESSNTNWWERHRTFFLELLARSVPTG